MLSINRYKRPISRHVSSYFLNQIFQKSEEKPSIEKISTPSDPSPTSENFWADLVASPEPTTSRPETYTFSSHEQIDTNQNKILADTLNTTISTVALLREQNYKIPLYKVENYYKNYVQVSATGENKQFVSTFLTPSEIQKSGDYAGSGNNLINFEIVEGKGSRNFQASASTSNQNSNNRRRRGNQKLTDQQVTNQALNQKYIRFAGSEQYQQTRKNQVKDYKIKNLIQVLKEEVSENLAKDNIPRLTPNLLSKTATFKLTDLTFTDEYDENHPVSQDLHDFSVESNQPGDPPSYDFSHGIFHPMATFNGVSAYRELYARRYQPTTIINLDHYAKNKPGVERRSADLQLTDLINKFKHDKKHLRPRSSPPGYLSGRDKETYTNSTDIYYNPWVENLMLVGLNQSSLQNSAYDEAPLRLADIRPLQDLRNLHLNQINIVYMPYSLEDMISENYLNLMQNESRFETRMDIKAFAEFDHLNILSPEGTSVFENRLPHQNSENLKEQMKYPASFVISPLVDKLDKQAAGQASTIGEMYDRHIGYTKSEALSMKKKYPNGDGLENR